VCNPATSFLAGSEAASTGTFSPPLVLPTSFWSKHHAAPLLLLQFAAVTHCNGNLAPIRGAFPLAPIFASHFCRATVKANGGLVPASWRKRQTDYACLRRVCQATALPGCGRGCSLMLGRFWWVRGNGNWQTRFTRKPWPRQPMLDLSSGLYCSGRWPSGLKYVKTVPGCGELSEHLSGGRQTRP
jgi:hypothetical protein